MATRMRTLYATLAILVLVLAGWWLFAHGTHVQTAKSTSSGNLVLSSTTTDWKTYVNGEYGWEILYPANWPLGFTGNVLTIGNPNTASYAKCYLTITFQKSESQGSIIPASYKYNHYEEISEGQRCDNMLNKIISSGRFVK